MTFRQVIPNSTINPVNEGYEHYLVWLSEGGGVRNWLFSHTDGEEMNEYKGLSIESLTDIRSIPTEKRDEVKIITRGLDADEYDYVRSILGSNRIYKVTKSNEKIPVAVKYRSQKRPNQNKDYSLSLTLHFKESDTLNV